MDINIRINVDNAAFEYTSEVSRCLSQTAADILDAAGLVYDNRSGIIRDVNGNNVGEWHIIN